MENQLETPKQEVLKEKDWHLLEFSAPITENALVDNEFVIKGIAINETTTQNNHKYIAEELEKAAPGMTGKPLLVDHDNRVESIKGRVTNSFFDKNNKNIQFEARVMDKNIREMIKDGRIDSVSIGAYAEDLVKEEDSGSLIAKGLNIVELSLVAVPADNKANFASAMASNFHIKESLDKEKTLDIIERRYGKMTEGINQKVEEKSEDKVVETNNKLEETNNQLLEEIKSLKEEKKQNLIENYNKLCKDKNVEAKDVTNLTEETIKALIEQIEGFVIEEVVEEKAETKSVVSEKIQELPQEMESFVVERSPLSKGIAVWEMPDVEKWRKLHNNLPFKKEW